MPERDLPLIALLRTQFGARPFRVSEAVDASVSRTTLYRLRQRGELIAAGRGVLQLPDAGMGMLSSLAVASAQALGGTICPHFALAYRDVTDEITAQTHVSIPLGARRPTIEGPATIVHISDAETFELDRQRAAH